MPAPSYNDALSAFIVNLGGYSFDAQHAPSSAICLFWNEPQIALLWPDGAMIRLGFQANPRSVKAFTPILAGIGSLPPSPAVPNTIPVSSTIKQIVAMFWQLDSAHAADPVVQVYNEPNVTLLWPDNCEIRIGLRSMALNSTAIVPLWAGIGSPKPPPASVIISVNNDRYIADTTPFLLVIPDFTPPVDFTAKLSKAVFKASAYGPAPAGVTAFVVGQQSSSAVTDLTSATSLTGLTTQNPITAALIGSQPTYNRVTASGISFSGGMRLSGIPSNAGASPALAYYLEYTVLTGGPPP